MTPGWNSNWRSKYQDVEKSHTQRFNTPQFIQEHELNSRSLLSYKMKSRGTGFATMRSGGSELKNNSGDP